MKRFILILIAAIVMLAFSACRRVVVTSVDELTSKSWCAETLSGMKAQLIFDENTATLRIIGEEEISLSGRLSADPERFYITSVDNFKTYTFSYQVFYDKVKVIYNGAELVFYPCDTTQTPDEY